MGKPKFLPLVSLGALLLSSCSAMRMFEKDLYFEVVDGETVWQSGKINIFNNALLPTAPEKAGYLFYRYLVGVEPFDLETTPEQRLLMDAGLLRYNDSAMYAVGGKLTVTPIYLTPDQYPRPYLHVGWYDKTSKSKVDQTTIDRWTPDLITFLEGYGASDKEISKIKIKGYSHNGNVSALGNDLKKDGTVDIVLGCGGNIDSKTGSDVTIVEKYQITLQDENSTAWRYIALLTDRPQARATYEWLKTFEGHRALTGE